jgi:hypothetical protein
MSQGATAFIASVADAKGGRRMHKAMARRENNPGHPGRKPQSRAQEARLRTARAAA